MLATRGPVRTDVAPCSACHGSRDSGSRHHDAGPLCHPPASPPLFFLFSWLREIALPLPCGRAATAGEARGGSSAEVPRSPSPRPAPSRSGMRLSLCTGASSSQPGPVHVVCGQSPRHEDSHRRRPGAPAIGKRVLDPGHVPESPVWRRERRRRADGASGETAAAANAARHLPTRPRRPGSPAICLRGLGTQAAGPREPVLPPSAFLS